MAFIVITMKLFLIFQTEMSLKENLSPKHTDSQDSSSGMRPGGSMDQAPGSYVEYIYEESEEDQAPFLSRDCQPDDIITIESDSAGDDGTAKVSKGG